MIIIAFVLSYFLFQEKQIVTKYDTAISCLKDGKSYVQLPNNEKICASNQDMFPPLSSQVFQNLPDSKKDVFKNGVKCLMDGKSYVQLPNNENICVGQNDLMLPPFSYKAFQNLTPALKTYLQNMPKT